MPDKESEYICESDAAASALGASVRNDSDVPLERAKTGRNAGRIAASSRNAFGELHPAVALVFFIIAIVATMVLLNPAFLVVSLIGSTLNYLAIRGVSGIRALSGIAVLAIVIAVVNPLFNTSGQTVMFSYFDGRPYTFEALSYGIAVGAMVMAVMLWFLCMNSLLGAERIMSLGRNRAPSISTAVSMVMRMLPMQRRRLAQISDARACIGKGISYGSLRERVINGAAVLEAAFDPSLEMAIDMSDSMRSRGYGLEVGDRGCGSRTPECECRSWAIRSDCESRVIKADCGNLSGRLDSRKRFRRRCRTYVFSVPDAVVLAVIVGLAAGIAICASFGGASYSYMPAISFVSSGPAFILGIVLYACFLSIPVCIDFADRTLWKISLDKLTS